MQTARSSSRWQARPAAATPSTHLPNCACRQNKIKINDWSAIQTLFDKLNKQLEKTQKVTMSLGVPRKYVRILVELEDSLATTLADKVGPHLQGQCAGFKWWFHPLWQTRWDGLATTLATKVGQRLLLTKPVCRLQLVETRQFGGAEGKPGHHTGRQSAWTYVTMK